MEFVKGLAKSFAKGQPCAKRIGLTLFRDQVHNVLKNIHSHSAERQKSGHVLE
jgi:pyruvate dehydrogenase (quinone)/pyruvate oxidase